MQVVRKFKNYIRIAYKRITINLLLLNNSPNNQLSTYKNNSNYSHRSFNNNRNSFWLNKNCNSIRINYRMLYKIVRNRATLNSFRNNSSIYFSNSNYFISSSNSSLTQQILSTTIFWLMVLTQIIPIPKLTIVLRAVIRIRITKKTIIATTTTTIILMVTILKSGRRTPKRTPAIP